MGKIVKGVGNTTVDDTPQPTAGTVVDAAPAAPEAEHGAGLASDPAPEARDPHQAEGAGTPVPKTARKADLVEAVVAAGLATEDEAATLTVPDLRALLDTTSTKEPDPE